MRFAAHGIVRWRWVSGAKPQDKKDTDLAIILPGSATLTVHSLPLVGLKTAVGLVVSSSAGQFEEAPLGRAFASDWRFRFCRTSATFYNTSTLRKTYFCVCFSSAHCGEIVWIVFEFLGGEK